MGFVRNHSRVGIGLVGATILALTAGACSGDNSGDQEPSARPPGSTGGAATPAAPDTSAGAPALPVLASRDASVKATPIRVELNELQVEGRVTRLTFTARNLAPAVSGQSARGWQIATFFNDGITQKSGAASDDAFSVDGVYLIDPAGAKRYLAARNATKGCVCSTDLGDTFVSPGSGVVLTTLFAALPAGVTSVDVVVPGFGPFNDVAVTR
jgi:hypothetical protein